MLLIQEGVNQVYPLSIFLYCITLISLVEELQAADPGLITPFYSDDAEFNRLALSSAQLLNMLMERGTDWGYFPKPSNKCLLRTHLSRRKQLGGSLWHRA